MKPVSLSSGAAPGEDLPPLYSVNQLAEELGVTPRTIRFYETKGLVSPQRAGHARVFTRRDRARLLLVLRGKRLGFSLGEIREYLELYDARRSQASQIRLLLEHTSRRIGELESQRRDLEQTLAELRDIERQAQAALTGRARAAEGGEARAKE
jgi:DNA-binding transcriptional MerR regulator